MSGARETILAAVRAGLGDRQPDPDRIGAEAQALLAAPDEIRPRLADPDPATAFTVRAATLSVGTSVERVATFADLPRVVHHYLERQGLPARIAL